MCEESGCDDVNLIAYCMGGSMIMHALAAQPDLPVRSMATIASPFDFRHLGAMVDALREGKLEPDELLDSSGNVPGSLVRQSFKSRKPTADVVNYANLWQHLGDERYLEGHQAIARFLEDQPPVAGAAFRQFVQQVRDNAFVNDCLRFGGRRVSLADVQLPVLGVVAEHDDITLEASATAIVDVLPGAQVELLTVDAGHVSLFAGRQAVQEVLPQIFEWIEGRCEEAG